MKVVRVGLGHTRAIYGPSNIKTCRLTFANEGLGISDTCVVAMFMCRLLVPVQAGSWADVCITAKTSKSEQPEYHTRRTDTRKEGSVQRGKSQDAGSEVTTQLDQDDLAGNERHTQDHGCTRTAIVVAVVGMVRVLSQSSQRLPLAVPPGRNEEGGGGESWSWSVDCSCLRRRGAGRSRSLHG